LFEEVEPIEKLPPGADFRRFLVPMKLGPIGEEMIATAVALAKEGESEVHALFVIQVPLDLALDDPMHDKEEQAAASLAEAVLLGDENDVRVESHTVRARSIGQAIVQEAQQRKADLIVLGSAPRWRRQSRFFSPTVDYVLRRAPAEVLIVAFPQGALEEA
jgi:basic amino acid/polyamine antiporter, APA family